MSRYERGFFHSGVSGDFPKSFDFLNNMQQIIKFCGGEERSAGSMAPRNIFWRAGHIHMAGYGRYDQKYPISAIIEHMRGGSIIILESEYGMSIQVLEGI